MAEQIKGITIEIGGNTVGLTKAIGDVNRETNATQKELREVERLLKLDPKNTELLAQKQKLLGDQVATVSGKLDALKSAQAKVDNEIASGVEINQAQYRKLQREIVSTEQGLKKLEKQSKECSDSFKSTGESLEKFGNKTSELGKKGLVASAGMVALGAMAFNSASDLSESLNKVDVAFKGNANEVKAWAETSLKNFGLSRGTALETTSLYGDMGTAMGQTTSEASKMSTSLTGVSADLASYKNVSQEVAKDALKGIYTGEGESLKSLGIIMQESTLKEYALANGYKKKYEDMTQAEKVQLRYNFVMNATKDAQGDYARTSNGAANSTRAMQESTKELSAQLGEILLPIITPIIQKITEFVQWLSKLDPTSKTIIVVLGIIAGLIPPLIILIGSMITGIGAITTAIGAMNFAFLASPFVWVPALVITLVALIIKLWNTNEGFRNAIISAWNAIKEAGMSVWNWLVNFFTKDIPNAFNTVLNFVKNNWKEILLFITNPIAGALAFLYKLNPQFKEWVDGLVSNIKSWFGGMVDVGRNIVEGLWVGLQEKVSWLTNKINGWGGAILDFIKKVFGIQSPSKYTREFGRFLVEGLAVGITEEMSAEEAAKKKADNILNAFNGAKGGIGTENDIAKGKYELWLETVGKTATEEEKAKKQAELLNDQLDNQNNIVDLTKMAYDAMVKTYGAANEESKKLEAQLLSETLTQQKLKNEILDTQKARNGTLTSAEKRKATEDFSDYLNKYTSVLLKSGISYDSIVSGAKKATGYDKVENNQRTVNVTNNLQTVKQNPSEIANETKRSLQKAAFSY